MTDAEILSVLDEALSVPLTPEELAELCGRVRQQEEMSVILRSVPLGAEDPYWPPGEEPA